MSYKLKKKWARCVYNTGDQCENIYKHQRDFHFWVVRSQLLGRLSVARNFKIKFVAFVHRVSLCRGSVYFVHLYGYVGASCSLSPRWVRVTKGCFGSPLLLSRRMQSIRMVLCLVCRVNYIHCVLVLRRKRSPTQSYVQFRRHTASTARQKFWPKTYRCRSAAVVLCFMANIKCVFVRLPVTETHLESSSDSTLLDRYHSTGSRSFERTIRKRTPIAVSRI